MLGRLATVVTCSVNYTHTNLYWSLHSKALTASLRYMTCDSVKAVIN